MSVASSGMTSESGSRLATGLFARLWRETSRPFRRESWRKWSGSECRHSIQTINTKMDRLCRELETLSSKVLDVNVFENAMSAGSVEPEGLDFLRQLVERSRQLAGPIVEIGTLYGRTTTHMALFKEPSQKIITVDCYVWNPMGLRPDLHFQLTSQVLHYLVQTGHIEQKRMDKNLFYATYRGPAPALVFLDANHTYEETKKDVLWAKSVGAQIIAGHDYSPEFPGVEQVVHEFGGPRETRGTVFLL